MSGARFVRANGLRFAYLTWGAPDAPLALLLHGFPDHALTWRHLGPELAAAGYRAVAPWLRGYAPTEVPSDDRDVDLDTLAADTNALHRALGGDRDAVLVGHDWGAMAAYRAAAAAPGRWRRVVTMAVPPEPAMRGAMSDPRQLRRSWYVAAFQLPGVRRLAASDPAAVVTRLWREWSPGHEPADDRRSLEATLRSPGTLPTALGYYRELRRWIVRGRYPGGAETVPSVAGLYLHGAGDGCVGVAYAEAARRLDGGPRVEILAGVGHFLHLEAPARVAELVLPFLGPATAPAGGGHQPADLRQ